MGIQPKTGLADALFSGVRQRVLALLFGQPERRYQSSEIIRLVDGGTGAVQRELARLEGAGLVIVSRMGRLKFFQANPNSPVAAELTGLVIKTFGLVEPLRNALLPLKSAIREAFIYGSVAKGADTASSDIDLMIISTSLDYSDVYRALESVEAIIGRKINPTLLTPTKWRRRRLRSDSFAYRVDNQPKTVIIAPRTGERPR